MALPDTIKVSALTNLPTGISNQQIAENQTYISETVIDNTNNRSSFMVLEALWSGNGDWPLGEIVICLLKSVDGTHYDEVSDITILARFPPTGDYNQHRRIVCQDWPLQACKYKFVVINGGTRQTITMTLTAKAYDMVVED